MGCLGIRYNIFVSLSFSFESIVLRLLSEASINIVFEVEQAGVVLMIPVESFRDSQLCCWNLNRIYLIDFFLLGWNARVSTGLKS